MGFMLRGLIEGDQISIKELLTSIVTLMAVYAGASYAFKLQNDKTEREEEKKQVASSNRAIYTIFEMWNVQKQYQKEIIDPCKMEYGIWISLMPTISGLHELIKFNTENLEFLLHSGKPEVYSNLLLEEKRYRIAISTIEERSKLVLNDLFPKMESLGYKKDEPIDVTILEPQLGPDLTTKLKDLTTSIITIIDENILSLESIYDDLQKYVKEILPNKKLITVEFKTSNNKTT